jgi:cobalt-zinc-cadmium efflux system protein
MQHSHDHHCHGKHLEGKRLLWVTALNFAITLLQIAGGIVSNSLSLLSDALHNLGDSSAILIAFVAGKIGKKQPDEKRTFGYKRIEILAALFNGAVLMAICLYLFVEAWRRLMHPEPIHGKIMLWVALFGLLANLVSVMVLHKDKNHNLNIKAAYLHLLGDTLSSVAVITGGIAIWLYGVYWIDPAITFLVGMYIMRHTWSVVRETVDILMDAAPSGLNVQEIKTAVESVSGIKNLHHLHVWKLDDTRVTLEAHVDLRDNITMREMMVVRNAAEKLIHETFGVEHVTLQMGYGCCDGNEELIIRRCVQP